MEEQTPGVLAEDGEMETWVDISTTADDIAYAKVRDKHELELDEPDFVPFGNDTAPCPGDYLLVATAGCQVEVLKHCFEKARVDEYEMTMHVERDTEFPAEAPEPFPAEKGVRYSAIHMELDVETTPEYEDRVRRCLDVCEDACLISRSVEEGIEFTLDKSLTVSD